MTKATILIVDDDVANIEIMNAVLEDDYDVCFAMSGEEAIETARTVDPDLILLDIVLPGLDGFEVCRELKVDPVLADVPIIFMTGLDDSEDEMRGLSLGAIDYVAKPIQPAILRARVSNHVELKRLRDKLAELAVTDALTGLSNRRQLERTLEAEWSRMCRSGDWLSVIMLDIDFFKQFNDTYGHVAGDRCIVMIAATLNRALRRVTAVTARYGGEEFVCILPGADPASARQVAEEIRRQVNALQIPYETSQVSSYVTVSIGVASARCTGDMTPERWIAEADKQLYLSKVGGRDRIVGTQFQVTCLG
ncbi:diguanylate cyclase [Novosphingobium sp. ST904]|uniref:GGDEF domain-containing response regulator n=1 Tax=Novosphingobium sp. ST904 TaxID=1684385 RepID=UPI0006C8B794|nr:diguanylate cyclase [Novosphingobium sp. ST904]KPH65894.1 diguanylate cyclase [Novosphingobium sp. ST904]TCM35251.1 diguanylate cyclase (GGDEF)-like protein [Novosphingobium sp. ST904]